jgi:HAD superfamily hydrolase (TIGR01549 family)
MTTPVDRCAVKYISFDLYGTLFRYDDLAASWQRWATVLFENMQSMGLVTDFATFHQHCDAFFSQDIDLLDHHTVFSSRVVKFAEQLDIVIDRIRANEIADECCHAWHEHISLHPDAVALLQGLKPQFDLFLVTNFDHPPFVREMLSTTGIFEYFCEVVISGELGAKKPQREIFDVLRAKYDIQKNHCVHIGDSVDDYHFSTNNDLIPVLIGEKGKINGVIDYAFNSTQTVHNAIIVDDLTNVGHVLKQYGRK